MSEQYQSREFSVVFDARDVERHIDLVLRQYRVMMNGPTVSTPEQRRSLIVSYLKPELDPLSMGLHAVLVDKNNFEEFRDAIAEIERRTYEPARVTPVEEYEKSVNNWDGIVIAIMRDRKAAAMIAGFDIRGETHVRGVDRDPYRNDPNTYYMLATTVDPEYRGHALGERLKCCFFALGVESGWNRIQGRNRDRLARTMLSVNYSLGAKVMYRVENAYDDDSHFRDAIYYTIPVRWEGDQSALAARGIDEKCIKDNFLSLATEGRIGV